MTVWQFDVALLIGATTVLLLGLASGYVKNRLWLSEPLLALMVGIAVGPAGLHLVDLDFSVEADNAIFLEAARVTLALSVMGAALRLPRFYERKRWRELLVILGIGMPIMCLAGSAVAWAVLSPTLLVALLIGAVLAPTDPVLADSVLTGRIAEDSLPQRLRDTISAESGANDGLALLLVMLPVSLMTAPTQEALTHWLTGTLLQHIFGGIAIGAALGWLSARLLRWVQARPFTDETSILTVAVALALVVLAVDRLMETAAILAVFVAGLFLNHSATIHEEAMHERTEAAVGRFFDIPIFIFFGAVLPWQAWVDLGWAGPLAAVLILLLRRLPAWLVLRPLLPSVQGWRDARFAGWFGPIGVAALFYAAKVRHDVDAPEVWALASLVVFASIVLHGTTATPFIRRFG